jgi:hypothetical protein
MANYLVVVETGKNKFGNIALHVRRSSYLFEADNAISAANKVFEKDELGYRKINISHGGMSPDYECIIDIKKIEE